MLISQDNLSAKKTTQLTLSIYLSFIKLFERWLWWYTTMCSIVECLLTNVCSWHWKDSHQQCIYLNWKISGVDCQLITTIFEISRQQHLEQHFTILHILCIMQRKRSVHTHATWQSTPEKRKINWKNTATDIYSDAKKTWQRWWGHQSQEFTTS